MLHYSNRGKLCPIIELIQNGSISRFEPFGWVDSVKVEHCIHFQHGLAEEMGGGVIF
jgi:hypothetical protein